MPSSHSEQIFKQLEARRSCAAQKDSRSFRGKRTFGRNSLNVAIDYRFTHEGGLSSVDDDFLSPGAHSAGCEEIDGGFLDCIRGEFIWKYSQIEVMWKHA
jgi:hypothetical protein